MSQIHQLLTQISIAEWIAIATGAIILLFVWWSRANQPFFFDFLMNFPIRLWGPIGKFRKLKKDTTNLNERNQKWRFGMSPQEVVLSSAYKDKIGELPNEEEFNNRLEYLETTGQGSVRPMSLWLWGLMFVLTMGEAAGTGALLSEYVSTNVTSNEVANFTWAIAIVLALVLLGLTHMAGTTFFERKTFKDILGSTDSEAKPKGYVDGKDDVLYHSNQFVDRGRPQPVRFYARLEKKKARGSLVWTILAVIFLGIIMAAVFGGRMYGIAKQNTLEVTQIAKHGVNGADDGGSNPFANMDGGSGGAQAPLPPDVAKAQADSRKHLANEIGSDNLGQGLMAAILLAVFYVIVQLVGFGLAMKHAFFQHGKDAYNDTRGCRSYSELMDRFFHPYEARAESRLSELRSAYARVNENYSNNMPTTSFADYYHQAKLSSRNAEGLAKSLHEAQAQEMATQPASTTTTPAAAESHAPAPTAAQETSTDLNAIAEEILDLPGREERATRLKQALTDLPEDQRTQLRETIAKVKKERERQTVDISDFDDLI